MESAEWVFESYCRTIREWFMIPRLKCAAVKHETDLDAIDVTPGVPKTLEPSRKRNGCFRRTIHTG